MSGTMRSASCSISSLQRAACASSAAPFPAGRQSCSAHAAARSRSSRRRCSALSSSMHLPRIIVVHGAVLHESAPSCVTCSRDQRRSRIRAAAGRIEMARQSRQFRDLLHRHVTCQQRKEIDRWIKAHVEALASKHAALHAHDRRTKSTAPTPTTTCSTELKKEKLRAEGRDRPATNGPVFYMGRPRARQARLPFDCQINRRVKRARSARAFPALPASWSRSAGLRGGPARSARR